MGQNIFWY